MSRGVVAWGAGTERGRAAGAQQWLEVTGQGHSPLARVLVQGECLAEPLSEEFVACVGAVWGDE